MQQIDLYRRSKVERPATKFQSHCNLAYITVHQSRFGKADCCKQGHVSFLPASFFLHAWRHATAIGILSPALTLNHQEPKQHIVDLSLLSPEWLFIVCSGNRYRKTPKVSAICENDAASFLYTRHLTRTSMRMESHGQPITPFFHTDVTQPIRWVSLAHSLHQSSQNLSRSIAHFIIPSCNEHKHATVS